MRSKRSNNIWAADKVDVLILVAINRHLITIFRKCAISRFHDCILGKEIVNSISGLNTGGDTESTRMQKHEVRSIKCYFNCEAEVRTNDFNEAVNSEVLNNKYQRATQERLPITWSTMYTFFLWSSRI